MIKDGKIEDIIHPTAHKPRHDDEVIDAEGSLLIPGFIDTHIHGANGYDVMDNDPQALSKIAEYLVSEGTTSFLATTMTASYDALDNAMRQVKLANPLAGTAECLGIHLEGPFVNKKKKGAQPEPYIVPPDSDQFLKMQTLSGGKIKTITLAPEKDPDFSFIQQRLDEGLTVSMGHTDVTFEQAQEAIQAGVSQITHLGNQMNGLHHRAFGLVGAGFYSDVFCELIADGIHVDKHMVNLIYTQVTPKRLLLITDAMRAKGLSEGLYDLGDQEVMVKGNEARLNDGTLAGSVLRMIDAVRFMLNETPANLRDIIQMTAVNPAKQTGIYDRKGSITIGKDADFILLNQDYQLKMTVANGCVGFREESS